MEYIESSEGVSEEVLEVRVLVVPIDLSTHHLAQHENYMEVVLEVAATSYR